MKKKMLILLIVIIGLFSFIGCSKSNVSENSQTGEKVEQEEEEFDLYGGIIDADYRGIDMDKVFRDPEDCKNKTFTFVGKVLESNTDDKNIQHVIFEIQTDMYIWGESHEEMDKAELTYDVNSFDGERIVKDDEIFITGKFLEIKNNDEYGDLPVFDVIARGGVQYYISTMALMDYLDSTGIDLKSMNFKFVEDIKAQESLYEAIKDVIDENFGNDGYENSGMSKDEYYDMAISNATVFSSESGVYWVIMSNMNGHYDELYIYTGKDEDGSLKLEYKSYASTQEMEL